MDSGLIVMLFFAAVVAGIVYVIYDEVSTGLKIKTLTRENEALKREVEFYSHGGMPVNNPDQRKS